MREWKNWRLSHSFFHSNCDEFNMLKIMKSERTWNACPQQPYRPGLLIQLSNFSRAFEMWPRAISAAALPSAIGWSWLQCYASAVSISCQTWPTFPPIMKKNVSPFPHWDDCNHSFSVIVNQNTTFTQHECFKCVWCSGCWLSFSLLICSISMLCPFLFEEEPAAVDRYRVLKADIHIPGLIPKLGIH